VPVTCPSVLQAADLELSSLEREMLQSRHKKELSDAVKAESEVW